MPPKRQPQRSGGRREHSAMPEGEATRPWREPKWEVKRVGYKAEDEQRLISIAWFQLQEAGARHPESLRDAREEITKV